MFVQAAEGTQRLYTREADLRLEYTLAHLILDSIVQLLFHGEPLKLANGLDMVSPLLLVLIYILVGGGG